MNKQFIFIPYQDSDDYFSNGILTREYAMLYMINEIIKDDDFINLKKPRTQLDKKKVNLNKEFFPQGSIESKVFLSLRKSTSIPNLSLFSFSQILRKRDWWKKGYKKMIPFLNKQQMDYSNTIVYSDNPFASEILKYLHEQGAYIYFDIMDNFAIHPSLWKSERESALEGYIEILKFADVVSANSDQTQEFMSKYRPNIYLIKNGVFAKNEVETESITQLELIKKTKRDFKSCVGYIGKLGIRLDARLIKTVTSACPETLFVFVGPFLKDQPNTELNDLLESAENILYVPGIPSSYVYTVCDEFDMLSIPHSRGESENGGDPLKLYQYMTRNKPVISTNILGVSEFSNSIKISNDPEEWISYINDIPQLRDQDFSRNVDQFEWHTRFEPIAKEIEEWIN